MHSTLHFHSFTPERKSFAFRIFNSHQVRCIAIATSTTRSTLDRDLDCAVILFSRPRMDLDEELQQFSINCPAVSTLIQSLKAICYKKLRPFPLTSRCCLSVRPLFIFNILLQLWAGEEASSTIGLGWLSAGKHPPTQTSMIRVH